jgi:hypothetical protein
MKKLVVVVLAASAQLASADPPIASSQEPARTPPPEAQPVPTPPEPDARDSRGAPLPGQESGRLDPDPGDSAGRKVARAVLWVPKMLLEAVLLPVDGVLYVEGRYQLEETYYRLLYFRNRTISITPTAAYATGFGTSIGARFMDTDTFGERERFVLQATSGTTYRVGLLGSLDSGKRFGPLKVGIEGNFDRRPAEPFFGIGNEGHISPVGVKSNINAFDDSTAVETYFRYQELRASGRADLALTRQLSIGGGISYIQLEYSHDTHIYPSADLVYDPTTLVGFNSHINRLYGELDLQWDGREPTTRWEPSTMHGSGSLALVYGGRSHSLDEGQVDFWHYGTELQHYFHLGFGPRLLVARFHGEAVTGPIDEIPLTELPMLGGGTFLRGYDYARFRDRIAMVGTLQYMWSVTSNGSAFLWTDVGRVYRDWNAVTLDDLHVGFGVGLEMYLWPDTSVGPPTFLADLGIGSSSNGGVAIFAEFTPILDQRTRWR